MFLELEIMSYWLMVNGLLESGKCYGEKIEQSEGGSEGKNLGTLHF